MITLPLSRATVAEPVETWSHTVASYRLTDCRAGDSGWRAISYLPQLALIVMEHRAGHSCIVPIAQVWHMTTMVSGSEPLELLASVNP